MMHRKNQDTMPSILLFLFIIFPIINPVKSQVLKQEFLSLTDYKIEKAYHEGQISPDQRALYHAYALLDPEQLPAEFQGTHHDKCATWVLNEIFKTWDHLSPLTKMQLEQLGFRSTGTLKRPSGLDSTRTTKHFRIHYSVTSGDTNAVSKYDGNKNGTPDYIDMVMDILEYVWVYFEDSLNYYMPPPDSIEGGDDLYDVYIYDLEDGVYGYVQPEKIVGDNPNSVLLTERYSATSYMALRNNYFDFDGSDEKNLKVTIAHEFFHAVQSAYDVYQKAWLMEATATWVEDVIYDEINDNYQYLLSWFQEPYTPLDANYYESPGHWYGSWIFFRYLEEHVAWRGFVRSIWERSVVYDTKSNDYSMHIIKEKLREIGATFEETFQNFALANWFRTISPYNYEEGSNYPQMYSIATLWGENGFKTFLKRYANHYIIISPNLLPANGVDKIKIFFTPLDTKTRFYVLVAYLSGNYIEVERFYPTSRTVILEDTQNLDEILVIVSNPDTAGTSNEFQIELESNSSIRIIYSGLFEGDHIYKSNESRIVFFSHGQYLETQDIHYTQLNNIDIRTGFNRSVYIEGYPKYLSVGDHVNNIIWAKGPYLDELLYGFTGSGVKQFTQYWRSDKRTPPPFSFNPYEVKPDVDNNKVWLYGTYYQDGISQGTGLYTISTVDLSVSKIFEIEISEGKIITDGEWTAFGYTEFDNWDKEVLTVYSSTSVIPVATYESSEVNDYTLYNFDFRDSVVVWVHPPDSFPTLRAFHIGNGTYKDLDGNPTTLFSDKWKFYRITRFATGKEHIIWTRTYWEDFNDYWNGEYPDSTALLLYKWGDSSAVILESGFGGVDNLSPFVFDNNGVGWIYLLDYSGARFNYYEFTTKKLYSLYLDIDIIYMDTFAEPPVAYPFTLIDGVFYVLAKRLRGENRRPQYIIAAVDIKGQNLTKIRVEDKNNIPKTVQLEQNYPNPFNAVTIIPLYLPQQMRVKLTLFDILGRKVKTILDKELPAGNHNVRFDASTLSSGVYYYQLKTRDFLKTKKMILLK